MTNEIILITATGLMFFMYVFIGLKYSQVLTKNERLEKELKEKEKNVNGNIFLSLGTDPETEEEIVENSNALRGFAKNITAEGFGEARYLMLMFIEQKVKENSEKMKKLYEAIEN